MGRRLCRLPANFFQKGTRGVVIFGALGVVDDVVVVVLAVVVGLKCSLFLFTFLVK